MAINWEEAPEGTTHGTEDLEAVRIYGSWRKLEEDKWYYHRHGGWVFRSDSKTYLLHNPHLVERPPEIGLADAALPNGLVWPEWATYYHPNFGGFFFNEEKYQMIRTGASSGWVTPNMGGWGKSVGTVVRRPVGKVQPKEVAPAKKKQVGWW